MENFADIDGNISHKDRNENIKTTEEFCITSFSSLNETDSDQYRKIQREDTYNDVSFPTLIRRVQAMFIDLGVLFLVFFITTYLTVLIGEIPSWLKMVILLFMIYLYDPVLVSIFGGTIGHKMMNMRVKRYSNPNKNIWIFAALLRYLIKILLGWISFITVTLNKNKRSLHDMASGSIVIDKNKKPPLTCQQQALR